MVPEDFRKGLCVTAGSFTLFVAIIWEIITIYVVGVFNCAWDFIDVHQDHVTSWNMLYLTYFMGECRRAAAATDIGFTFTPPAKPASNLQIWMYLYLGITAVWIPASIMLLVAATRNMRGRTGAALYYPWLCCTLVLCILDFGSTIYHVVDLCQSLDLNSYAKLTGSQDWSSLAGAVTTDNLTPWLPSLLICLLCSRFVVIWVINIFFIFNVCKASSAVSLYKTKQLQPLHTTLEKENPWKDSLYEGTGTEEVHNQPTLIVARPHLYRNASQSLPNSPTLDHLDSAEGSTQDEQTSRYIVDRFGIPIDEIDISDPREISHNENEGYLPRTPYQPERVFDFEQSFKQDHQVWHEDAPPIASGVRVPPELNSVQPFSYMAGDQPQKRIFKPNLSRSNSRAEYPNIPRPDYTIADRNSERRSASLEYIPHRFKVPSAKPYLPYQSSVHDLSPTSPRSPISPRKVAPPPPKKPQFYPKRSVAVSQEDSVPPNTVHLPQQNMSPTFFSRQTSQNNNYNINKLY